MSSSFSSSNLAQQQQFQQQQQQLDNVLSVEKSLAKLNLNLHDILDGKKEEEGEETVAHSSTNANTFIYDDRDLIKDSESAEASDSEESKSMRLRFHV